MVLLIFFNYQTQLYGVFQRSVRCFIHFRYCNTTLPLSIFQEIKNLRINMRFLTLLFYIFVNDDIFCCIILFCFSFFFNFFYFILFCFVLFCFVLYCFVLCCCALFLFFVVLFYVVLCCFVFFFSLFSIV